MQFGREPPAGGPPNSPEQLPLPVFTLPTKGEAITSSRTGNTYWIEEQIGEGHFGIVFGCIDTWQNKLAAKILKPRNQTYDAVKQSAVDEFLKLVTLRHPAITYVHDAFEFRHTFYIVTERCHWPIHGLFALKGYAGSVWVRPIARCLLQAVHFIHTSGFVHQDIHPGNVFTSYHVDELLPDADPALTFKLGDLGIAKLVQNINQQSTILADWMLPPEFLDPREFGVMDQRVDIYHCGLLLLAIIQGRELRLTRDDVLAGVPRQLALELPSPLNFALEKALRRHVEYRTASALELWRDLNSAVQT